MTKQTKRKKPEEKKKRMKNKHVHTYSSKSHALTLSRIQSSVEEICWLRIVTRKQYKISKKTKEKHQQPQPIRITFRSKIAAYFL